MKKIHILFCFITILIGCGKTIEKPKIDSTKVIVSAEILTFDKLKFHQAEEMKYGCYCHPFNWHDGVEFKKEEAYYVKTKLNNQLLAELTESETFDKEYLLSRDILLYGKYHNRWEFVDSLENKICETEKFDGFGILEINRNGQIDELLIGPIPTKPSKLIIRISDSKFYPDNPSPEINLK